MNENDLRNACYDYADSLPMCKPIDTSTLNRGQRKFKRKKPGVADLHICAIGMFIAVETKIGKNGQSVGQKEYQLEVEGAGGSYWLIYDFDDFKRRIDNFKRG